MWESDTSFLETKISTYISVIVIVIISKELSDLWSVMTSWTLTSMVIILVVGQKMALGFHMARMCSFSVLTLSCPGQRGCRVIQERLRVRSLLLHSGDSLQGCICSEWLPGYSQTRAFLACTTEKKPILLVWSYLFTWQRNTHSSSHFQGKVYEVFKILAFTCSYTSFYNNFQAIRTKCVIIERFSTGER